MNRLFSLVEYITVTTVHSSRPLQTYWICTGCWR